MRQCLPVIIIAALSSCFWGDWAYDACQQDSDCDNNQFCYQGECLQNAPRRISCTPGTLFCQDNVAMRCGDDGLVEDREDCGKKAVCIGGICDANPVCVAGEGHCADNVWQLCNAQGNGLQTNQDCGGRICTRSGCVEPDLSLNRGWNGKASSRCSNTPTARERPLYSFWAHGRRKKGMWRLNRWAAETRRQSPRQIWSTIYVVKADYKRLKDICNLRWGVSPK